MRRFPLLACLMALVPTTPSHASSATSDEPHFLATLQLGAAPKVRYLDAAGKPVAYAAFAQQLSEGRDYSLTSDRQAGMAVLRLRPPGAPAGRFAFGRGDAFPPFELPSLQGQTQRLADFHGRYTLVSFFFAECVPCIAEVPTLNAYAREHGDMNFVAITYQDAATAGLFVRLRGLRWNVLHDGQGLVDTLGVGVYPTLMLLDPSGRVAGAAVGMSMRDTREKRLADLEQWIGQWRRPLPARR